MEMNVVYKVDAENQDDGTVNAKIVECVHIGNGLYSEYKRQNLAFLSEQDYDTWCADKHICPMKM